MHEKEKITAREEIKSLQDIPNVGPAIEKDMQLLGLHDPAQLPGQDPYQMFDALCKRTGTRHDPCVIDVFISAVRFMEGGPSEKWWAYTRETLINS